MYSESDIESAVLAGAISADSAAAFRAHVAAQRSTVLVDEESFRLLTGFNDIFVVIAIALLMLALCRLGSAYSDVLASSLVAAASWGLAEFFTRKRRMALPSILLLLTFVGGVAAAVLLLRFNVYWHSWAWFKRMDPANSALIGLAVVIATAAHWFRFRVPITIAAGALFFTVLLLSLLLMAAPFLLTQIVWLCLAGGLALFAFAMLWDISDRTRQTRRSDVAFWLHLVSAPMIAHPIFAQLGVFDGDIATWKASAVILLYVLFAGLSLAIDRRALLVSSLVYVLCALSALFETFGAVSLSIAFTALVIGSALLLLSAFWHPARRLVVASLPRHLRDRLPVLDRRPMAKLA